MGGDDRPTLTSARRWRGHFAAIRRTVESDFWQGGAGLGRHIGTASPAQRGALRRASRADGGGSAFIRGTLTPNPARMEADGTGEVYRVSPVDKGAFTNLFRVLLISTTILPLECTRSYLHVRHLRSSPTAQLIYLGQMPDD